MRDGSTSLFQRLVRIGSPKKNTVVKNGPTVALRASRPISGLSQPCDEPCQHLSAGTPSALTARQPANACTFNAQRKLGEFNEGTTGQAVLHGCAQV
jgi:hypothetical protein